jgi:hypothetical protein
MQKEIDQLDWLQTYELVALSEERKPIGCKWVFVIKQGSDREIIKYKARLVAQGFSQIPGQDFVKTYAPVCRQESLRASIAIAALLRMHVHQLDVVGVFLHGELEEEIYMRQPPEYNDGSERVWRLRKAIYGLKQAGQVWNIKLNYELSSLRFSQIPADACAFIRMDDKDRTIAIIHVDDMSLFSTSLDTLTQIKGEIASRLKVTDLGEIKKYLGMEINCNPRKEIYSIHQTAYIRSILERFNMLDCNPAHMPMDPTARLTITPDDVTPNTTFPYAAAIGSLMYAAVGTRPDIAFTVQSLSQFTSRPSPAHVTALKRIFHYLKGTADLGLVYKTVDSCIPTGYSDAD